MTSPASLYIGVLSGTSMDAIDCALLDFSSQMPRIVDFQCYAFPADLKLELLELITNEHPDLRKLGNADIEVASVFSNAILRLLEQNHLEPKDIVAIGSHGQTIWHEPPQNASQHPFTLQVGDPNTIAERTGITVVADFRRKDMAAGGQGAPIVPAMHREFFQSDDTDRIILNLGGIANITFLPKTRGKPLGMDTGPASVLMDGWIKLHRNQDYDDDGSWARSGTVDQRLLSGLLDEPYFSLPGPKSTGREFLNMAWLEKKLANIQPAPSPEDVQATLLEFTAVTISDQVLKLPGRGDLILCGGGARNGLLTETLKSKLPTFNIRPASDYGMHADSVEAVAFGWLAKKTLHREAVDFSPFTGARHPVLAGGIYFSEKAADGAAS